MRFQYQIIMVALENALIYDRYYLQDCKAITFGKIVDHTKYKKPNVPRRLHIF